MYVTRQLNQDTWRKFVDMHPLGNIFHTPEMFQVFAGAKGFEPSLWAAVDESGNPLALLLPVQIILKQGLMRHLTSRAVVYGSVLCSPGDEGLQALRLLLKTYASEKKNTPLFTELRNLTDLEEKLQVLQDTGFIYEPHLNYLIDLNLEPDAVFQNIGARTRKNIRRGLNKGEVLIEEISKREEIVNCYKLLQMTYQNAQVPMADISLFESAFDTLFEKGMIRFAQARIDGVDVCTSVELLYKKTMYGWFGGVDRAFGSYVPNELVMWNVLEWGARHGYHEYDFGGAGKPDEEYGVRDFKAKFGGKLVSFGRNIFVHKPLVLKLSKLGYQLLRRWL